MGEGVDLSGTKGVTGRKQNPVDLKMVTGKPGRLGINHSAPQVAKGEMIAPDWLDLVALDKWTEILRWAYWITRADTDMLAVYCDAYSRYLKAQVLAIQSPVLRGPDNKPYKNPAWTALSEAFNQLRSSGSELGLSPSSRSGLDGGMPANPLADSTESYFATTRPN